MKTKKILKRLGGILKRYGKIECSEGQFVSITNKDAQAIKAAANKIKELKKENKKLQERVRLLEGCDD